jgi:hypothetical protein
MNRAERILVILLRAIALVASLKLKFREIPGGNSGDTIHNYLVEVRFGPGFCRRNTRPRFFSNRF